jgi:hypothetical protein
MNRIPNSGAMPESNKLLALIEANSAEVNEKALWEYFAPPKWKKGPEYRFLVFRWNQFKAYEKRKCLGKNLRYLFARLKYTIFNFPGILKYHAHVILDSLDTDTPISRLLSSYKVLIIREFKFLTDAQFREMCFMLDAAQKESDEIERRSRLAIMTLQKCQNLVDDIYKAEHPIRFFIWRYYTKLIQFLSEKTYLKLTLFVSAVIIARVSIAQFIIYKYECKLAYAQNKLPKLKYFGLAGQKLKNLIGANINEIQIGINNTILTDLYNVPLSKQIYIQMPELHYSRKDFQAIKPVLKQLRFINFKNYDVRHN